MEIAKLSAEDINNLKEVGSIGAGNAASRLSNLINRRCMIDIPEVAYLNQERLINTFDLQKSFAVAILVKILGDVPAVMLVTTKKNDAYKIIQYMTKADNPTSGGYISFTAQFALKQLGEVLTKSFSDAISQFLKSKSKFAMPEVILVTSSTVLDVALKNIEDIDEEKLVIYSSFFDPEKTFEGKFIYILSQESQKIVLNRISLLLKDN